MANGKKGTPISTAKDLAKRRRRWANQGKDLSTIREELDRQGAYADPAFVKQHEAIEARRAAVRGDPTESDVLGLDSAMAAMTLSLVDLGLKVRGGGHKAQSVSGISAEERAARLQTAMAWLRKHPTCSAKVPSALAMHVAECHDISVEAARKFLQRNLHKRT